ncbi:MAG: hypothetical protein Q9218_003743 [Villophora microphyllina]
MSLGKLTASIFAGTQETTVALAALNFSFALFKTEVAQEYKPLEKALSPYRLELAEDGEIHTTVRILRAMFEPMLPAAPSLYKAYGVRASEIAKKLLKDSKTRHRSGAFSKYQGIDAGSIWAAATSGDGAVSIHLLACMLAKLWPPSEATSIWEEIVLRRKAQLSLADGKDMQSVLAACAARSNLARHQLANWDASARAWLRAGNEVVQVKQTQLQLITENIDKPVNTDDNVYDSVINAWTQAVIVMNSLIEGKPHSITDGAVLVAISAWHLFPNMSVPSTSDEIINQKDPLVDPQGILTLGFEAMQHENGLTSRGITWSLPLACHQYYGDPVRMQKAMNMEGSRVTVDQLLQIAIGCIFHGWREDNFTVRKAAEFLCYLWDYCTKERALRSQSYHLPSLFPEGWFGILAQAASRYLGSDSRTRQQCRKLFNIGHKICPDFLGINEESKSSIVALQHPAGLLGMAANHEGRLRVLRMLATTLGCDPRDMIIRYRLPIDRVDGSEFAIATVIPIAGDPIKAGSVHKRWVMVDTAYTGSNGLSKEEEAKGEIWAETLKGADIVVHNASGQSKLLWSDAPAEYSERKLTTGTINHILGDSVEEIHVEDGPLREKPRIVIGVPFECVLGNPAEAAIYCILGSKCLAPTALSTKDIRTIITQTPINFVHFGLIKHLGGASLEVSKSSLINLHMQSLKTLCSLVHIYRRLGEPTIAMNITSMKLWEMQWMPVVDQPLVTRQPEASDREVIEAFEPYELDLACSFGCIATLESGNMNVSSSNLQSVMALSSDDSLYIATALLTDPAIDHQSKVTRIRGNIGRAGIALMIPPKRPRMRQTDSRDWRIINHADFRGIVADSFRETSLHVSLTGFVFPLDSANYGFRDTEIYLLETVISVYDERRWVGDIKILPMFNQPEFRIINEGGTTCSHTQKAYIAPEEELTSIDSWDEFLDRPAGPVVFRAHGNWMARLAAASLSIQQKHLTLVFGKDVCWTCGKECWTCEETERDRLACKKRPIFIL